MFSLRSLFILVAFAALACAALLNRTELWGSVIIAVTLTLAVGMTIAVWISPSSRLFYAPFAGVIWGYFFVLFFDPLKGLEKNLITSKLIFEVWPHLVERKPNSYSPAIWAGDFYNIIRPEFVGGIQTNWAALHSLTGFYYTVHCCAAVLFGSVAGSLTVLANRGRNIDAMPIEKGESTS
jgi:hypothetical protein